MPQDGGGRSVDHPRPRRQHDHGVDPGRREPVHRGEHRGDVHATAAAAREARAAPGDQRRQPASCNGASCSYKSPHGDFTTLQRYANAQGQTEYSRRFQDGTYQYFDATGRLVRVADRYGNTTTYGYIGGLLATITDPVGLQTVFTYHSGYVSGSYLKSIVDPAGRETQFGYGGIQLTDIVAPGGTYAGGPYELQPRYNGTNRLTHWFDNRGEMWTVSVNATRRLSAIQAPAITELVGGTSTVVHPTTSIQSRENRVLPLPGFGTLASPTPALRPDSVYLTAIDPKGATTKVWSDGFGHATRVVEPDLRVWSITRNADGWPEHVTDGGANATSYGYASFGMAPYGRPLIRLWSVVDQTSGGVTQQHFRDHDAFEQPTRIVLGPENSVSSPQMHVHYKTDGSPERQIMQYRDGTGTIVRADTTIYTYDSRGRWTSTRNPHGVMASASYHSSGFQNVFQTSPAGGPATGYGYDGAGRVNQLSEVSGATTRIFYNALNRPDSTRDARGVTTRYMWSQNGRDLDSVRVGAARQRSYVYNELGWVISEADPTTATIQYRYDRGGNLTRRTNRVGQNVDATYDHLGRVLTRTADGVTTSYGYDPDRRYMWASNNVSTDTLRYGLDGRLTASITRRPGAQRYAFGHTTATGTNGFTQMVYVEVNNLTPRVISYNVSPSVPPHLKLSGGSQATIRAWGDTTTIDYDKLGRTAVVRLPGGFRMNHGYTSRNEPASLTFSNLPAGGIGADLTRSYGWDFRGRLKKRETGSDIPRTFSYDSIGQITAYADSTIVDSNLVCDNPWDFTSCRHEPVWGQVGGRTYTWSAAGNPTGSGITTLTGNRLTQYDGWAMTYDLEGNLLSRQKGGVSQTLTWNALGQLASVTSGGQTVFYGYDGFGRRVRRTVGTNVQQFVYNGNDLMLELDGSGNLLREYSYYGGIDRPHAVRSHQAGYVGTYYYTMEVPGHVTGLVNGSGTAVDAYDYESFGALTGEKTPGFHNPLMYMGREYDRATGLYYVRNRWYDPAVGRFISEDPIGLAGGINVYVYAGNSPMNLRDPMGLSPSRSECPVGTNPVFVPVQDANGKVHMVEGCVSSDGSLTINLSAFTAPEQHPYSGAWVPNPLSSRGPLITFQPLLYGANNEEAPGGIRRSLTGGQCAFRDAVAAGVGAGVFIGGIGALIGGGVGGYVGAGVGSVGGGAAGAWLGLPAGPVGSFVAGAGLAGTGRVVGGFAGAWAGSNLGFIQGFGSGFVFTAIGWGALCAAGL